MCIYARHIKGTEPSTNAGWCAKYGFVFCCDLCLACLLNTPERAVPPTSPHPHAVRSTRYPDELGRCVQIGREIERSEKGGDPMARLFQGDR